MHDVLCFVQSSVNLTVRTSFDCSEHPGVHVGRGEGERGAPDIHDARLRGREADVPEPQLRPPHGRLHPRRQPRRARHRPQGMGSLIKITSSYHALCLCVSVLSRVFLEPNFSFGY